MAAVIGAPGGFVPQVAVGYGTAGGEAVAVDATHPLPVAIATGAAAGAATYLDRSGGIAAAGQAQQLVAANAARRGFFIQNLSAGDLWLNSTGAASAGAPSIKVAAGQLYESPAHGVPATAISVLGATAGQSFAAREW